MKYNLLGKSDLLISEVSFGCMSLESDHQVNSRLLRKAYDGGINFFDTADIYNKGENEATLGRAFKGSRQNIIIGTKVGNVWRQVGSALDWNPSKSHILRSVEESLKRLQTDYIDLYQLHGGTIDDPIDETIDAFEILKKQGKIRYYGISSIRPNVIREYVKRSSIVSVMMQYSLLDRRPEETCLELLNQNTIGVLARGSLAKGLLVDKPATSYLRYSDADVERMKATVHQCSRENRTPTETAIRYVLREPAVATAVVGIRTSEQLQKCIQVDKSSPLQDSEIEQLRNSVEVNLYEEHR